MKHPLPWTVLAIGLGFAAIAWASNSQTIDLTLEARIVQLEKEQAKTIKALNRTLDILSTLVELHEDSEKQ